MQTQTTKPNGSDSSSEEFEVLEEAPQGWATKSVQLSSTNKLGDLLQTLLG